MLITDRTVRGIPIQHRAVPILPQKRVRRNLYTKINLRQTFFQSPLIDLPFGAERFIILRRLILRIQVLENQVSFCFSESLRFFGLGQAFTACSSRGKPCFSDINPFILAGELCWARTHR